MNPTRILMKYKIILPLLLLLIWHLPVPVNADFLRIDEYKAALKVDPKDHIAHYGLGRAYRQMGLYEDAIEEFEEVLKLEPLFPAAYFETGESHKALKRFKQAAEAYLEAIRMDPNYPEAHMDWVILTAL